MTDIPKEPTPQVLARDRKWQESLRDSLLIAQRDGFRLRPRWWHRIRERFWRWRFRRAIRGANRAIMELGKDFARRFGKVDGPPR